MKAVAAPAAKKVIQMTATMKRQARLVEPHLDASLWNSILARTPQGDHEPSGLILATKTMNF